MTGGPYRFTRNPDYVGQALIYAGASTLANRLWALLLLPLALVFVTGGVIEQEERYLNSSFGPACREYAGRLPRWL